MVDRALAFERPETRAAATYWAALCGQRLMPSRSELKPSAMRRFLQFVNLVDINFEADSYMVTLQGAHTQQVFGNLRGQKFRDLFPPEVVKRWRECFQLTRDTNLPVRLSSQVGTQGKLWLQCEVLIAPLSGRDGGLESLLWVFVSWDRDEVLVES